MQPQRLNEIIGQEDLVDRLMGLIEFSRCRGTAAGHILLTGEDGMGKKTFANIVANELAVGFQQTDARQIQQQGDLTAIIGNLKKHQVLLISNLQSLKAPFAERLLSVLQDGKLSIIIGSGPAQRTHLMDIHPFTLIATCPKKTDCPRDLLSEFSLVLNFQPYRQGDLHTIASSVANHAGISLEPRAVELIVQNCDRPSCIDRLSRRLARAIGKPILTREDVSEALQAFGMKVRSDAGLTGVGNLQELSGQEFEQLIVVLLSKMGFHAEMTKISGDGGIDIIATLDKPIFGGRYLFQCKRFTADSLIGAPTVRDFYGAVRADNAMKGIFITTSDFTAQAREFGEKVGIELINSAQLQKLFLEYGMPESQN